jgi:hypothetical protein
MTIKMVIAHQPFSLEEVVISGFNGKVKTSRDFENLI